MDQVKIFSVIQLIYSNEQDTWKDLLSEYGNEYENKIITKCQ